MPRDAASAHGNSVIALRTCGAFNVCALLIDICIYFGLRVIAGQFVYAYSESSDSGGLENIVFNTILVDANES